MKSKMWTIRGKQYDLDPWLEKHPGGKYMLEITRGTDCTELFESYHAPSLQQKYINQTLSKLETEPARRDSGVGEDDAYNYDWDNQPVYDEVREVVRAYRKEHGIKASDSVLAMAWYAVWAVVHYVTLVRWACGWGGLGESMLLGVSLWFYCGDLLHAGTHYALTYESTSAVVGWVAGWLFCFPTTWIRQHVVGHHSHTNVEGYDPDL
jgi:hypothetical protein